MGIEVIPLSLPEVLLVKPQVHADARGFFLESYNREVFAAAGIDASFVQDNHSRSTGPVLRGLHYQVRQPQGKLVRVTRGEVFDVAVDVRRSSPRCGQWVAARLAAENFQQLWIPPGFAHGFLALSDTAEVQYKTTDFHAPEHERIIRWDDPDIGIAWPLTAEPLLSAKDRDAGSLREADLPP